ncbi:hypothetical protein [Sphingobium xenophagum]|uniref:hypothetical protein n=1 Tax=Sphingobium xenophagum TaxID=121428 RepID=UPI00241FC058|nr:hypothetical protein [Sphingobium xenophagum]
MVSGLLAIEERRHSAGGIFVPADLGDLEHHRTLIAFDPSTEARLGDCRLFLGRDLHVRAFMRDDSDGRRFVFLGRDVGCKACDHLGVNPHYS